VLHHLFAVAMMMVHKFLSEMHSKLSYSI